MFSGLSGRTAGPSYGRKSPSGTDRCAAPPGKTERVSPQGYFCRPALPAECHFNTLLFPPLKIRAFAARRTARCKKRILADFERLTMSAESGFRLTRARSVAALCEEIGVSRRGVPLSFCFLKTRRLRTRNREKCGGKGGGNPSCRPFFPALRKNVRVCAHKSARPCSQKKCFFRNAVRIFPQKNPRFCGKTVNIGKQM